MNDGFSAFKAMAFGVAIIFAGTTLAPSVSNGQFDLLRITKGKGKGKSTLPPPDTTTDTGGTTTTGNRLRATCTRA